VPPNQQVEIADLAKSAYRANSGINRLFDLINTPELQLHCPHDSCNGLRFFRWIGKEEPGLVTEAFRSIYLTYLCANCQRTTTTFALAAKIHVAQLAPGQCCKFGELPPFGPPKPARLITLIGPDREEFLKGRRGENQGLGVGAFIYYRRVVENQKNRILAEIIKVAEKLNAEPETVRVLRRAVEETQFSKALDMAKGAIPQSLLVNGHSPLALLHGALSDGVHGRSDEECLEIASSVRVVLSDLSERLGHALKDEVELTKALSALMNRKKH